MYVCLALLLLGVLITAHEFGHFIAARLCGIEVVEFSMGMGPLLLRKKSKKGTQFSLRLLPIGGFCQFYGEDEEIVQDARAFNNQKLAKRILTVVSGPLMNFIIALLVVVLILSVLGLNTPIPRIAGVEPNAEQAGLRAGDVLLAVNGVEITQTSVVTQEIARADGASVTFDVLRGEEKLEIAMAPFYDEAESRYRVGITFDTERTRVSLLESIPFSVEYNVQSVRMIVETLKNLIFRGEGVHDVTGPVGTVYVIQEATAQGGLDIYLELLAMISVNLGVMNLLPIPGLDGSRLLFLIVEGIRRKPMKRELEGGIHAAGFVLLMGLMVLLTYKDIMTFFLK